MIEPASTTLAALEALRPPGSPISVATEEVPARPGLYAVHGSSQVWSDLGLGDPPDDRPLYVGKAEKSLASRDVRTHFSTGSTGSSTLRRSLAALLQQHLELRARPRNPAKPDHFASFGLESDGDERLTTWMCGSLRLATWESPSDVSLDHIESAVLALLLPPLNLAKVRTTWRPALLSARAVMAAEARTWESSDDDD